MTTTQLLYAETSGSSWVYIAVPIDKNKPCTVTAYAERESNRPFSAGYIGPDMEDRLLELQNAGYLELVSYKHKGVTYLPHLRGGNRTTGSARPLTVVCDNCVMQRIADIEPDAWDGDISTAFEQQEYSDFWMIPTDLVPVSITVPRYHNAFLYGVHEFVRTGSATRGFAIVQDVSDERFTIAESGDKFLYVKDCTGILALEGWSTNDLTHTVYLPADYELDVEFLPDASMDD